MLTKETIMVSTPQTTHNPEIRKPEPNYFLGIITNLSYQGSGNNLVEVKIQDNNFGEIFTLTSYCNVNLDFNNISITNLNEFQFRLQEAFNERLVVRICHKNSEIFSLEITQITQITPSSNRGGVGAIDCPPCPPCP